MAERLTVAEDVEGSSPFSHPIHTNTLVVTILIGQNNQGIVLYSDKRRVIRCSAIFIGYQMVFHMFQLFQLSSNKLVVLVGLMLINPTKLALLILILFRDLEPLKHIQFITIELQVTTIVLYAGGTENSAKST
jgi:hypothetical protein